MKEELAVAAQHQERGPRSRGVAHGTEAARLRKCAQEAVFAADALEAAAADAARSDLEFSRRPAAELARQLEAKAALCQDLQRTLDSKSEARRCATCRRCARASSRRYRSASRPA